MTKTFRHGTRPANYSPTDYFNEFGNVVTEIKADANIPIKNNMLLGPSVSSDEWTPELVFNTGFVPTYADSLYAITVEQ